MVKGAVTLFEVTVGNKTVAVYKCMEEALKERERQVRRYLNQKYDDYIVGKSVVEDYIFLLANNHNIPRFIVDEAEGCCEVFGIREIKKEGL